MNAAEELDARVAQREGEGALDLLGVGVVRRDAAAHEPAGREVLVDEGDARFGVREQFVDRVHAGGAGTDDGDVEVVGDVTSLRSSSAARVGARLVGAGGTA